MAVCITYNPVVIYKSSSYGADITKKALKKVSKKKVDSVNAK